MRVIVKTSAAMYSSIMHPEYEVKCQAAREVTCFCCRDVCLCAVECYGFHVYDHPQRTAKN